MKIGCAILAVMIFGVVSCAPPEVDEDAVGRKLGRESWGDFFNVRELIWNLSAVDSSKFTPIEKEFLLHWAREEEEFWRPHSRESCRIAFILLVKFKDQQSLEHLEKQFAKGWCWAEGAQEALQYAGEIPLLYLPAKFLFVDKATEPRPMMEDLIFPEAPSVYAAWTINRVLRVSPHSPNESKKAAKEIEDCDHPQIVEIYRRWWKDNERYCLRAKYWKLTNPLKYVDDREKKSANKR
jgi:hypothetical protein